MTPEEEITALKRKIADTERAAVAIILGILEGMLRSPEGRDVIAQSLEAEAEHSDEATAGIARKVAARLRENASP